MNEKTRKPIGIVSSIGWIGCPAMLTGVRIETSRMGCEPDHWMNRDKPAFLRGNFADGQRTLAA